MIIKNFVDERLRFEKIGGHNLAVFTTVVSPHIPRATLAHLEGQAGGVSRRAKALFEHRGFTCCSETKPVRLAALPGNMLHEQGSTTHLKDLVSKSRQLELNQVEEHGVAGFLHSDLDPDLMRESGFNSLILMAEPLSWRRKGVDHSYVIGSKKTTKGIVLDRWETNPEHEAIPDAGYLFQLPDDEE